MDQGMADSPRQVGVGPLVLGRQSGWARPLLHQVHRAEAAAAQPGEDAELLAELHQARHAHRPAVPVHCSVTAQLSQCHCPAQLSGGADR